MTDVCHERPNHCRNSTDLSALPWEWYYQCSFRQLIGPNCVKWIFFCAYVCVVLIVPDPLLINWTGVLINRIV